MTPLLVSVRQAEASDWPVLVRLWQLFQHDLSASRGLLPDRDGAFSTTKLEPYRTDPRRQAWLFRHGDDLAGFALTRPWERGGTSMYAFFVLRALRRTGVGRVAAGELLRLLPGEWGIAFQDDNVGARPFWELVARDAVGERWREESDPALDGRSPDVWLRLDTGSGEPAVRPR